MGSDKVFQFPDAEGLSTALCGSSLGSLLLRMKVQRKSKLKKNHLEFVFILGSLGCYSDAVPDLPVIHTDLCDPSVMVLSAWTS